LFFGKEDMAARKNLLKIAVMVMAMAFACAEVSDGRRYRMVKVKRATPSCWNYIEDQASLKETFVLNRLCHN
jgi:hypothetical protein